MKSKRFIKKFYLRWWSILIMIACFFLAPANMGYGKVKLPAKISFDIQGKASPEKPIKVDIDAVCKIPFRNGVIGIIIPGISNNPQKDIPLWKGEADSPLEKKLSYSLGVIPQGEHTFVAYFKFTPHREGTREVGVSCYLYMDIRSAIVNISNVSFGHIKRLELKEELKKRGLLELSIEEIKKRDPEMARRILEVNRIKSVETTVSKKKDDKESTSSQTEHKATDELIQEKKGEVKKVPPEEAKKISPKSKKSMELKKKREDVKKAPLQGTKKAVRITLNVEEKKRIEAIKQKNKYQYSTQAKEKREAIEKKKKEDGEKK
jgi:hypothetical protein